MNFRLLLYPFTLIYSAIMRIRNYFYDVGLLLSWRYKIPIICVGNITVGGTGKTPLTEYIIGLLKDSRPALVSRGYRRRTSGLVIATPDSTASDIGDEPKQVLTKFPEMPAAIDANRARAIDWLIANTDANVILMDDGMQHRSVQAGFNIVVVDYYRSMWSDCAFHMGNLREPWSARYRADIIVVNKCPPELSENEKLIITSRLKPRRDQGVFFTCIKYGTLRNRQGEKVKLSKSQKVVAVAGIGRPEPFFDEVKKRHKCQKCIAFGDHHNFDADDVGYISRSVAQAGSEVVVLTTEKDSTRFPEIDGVELYYLPIELSVLFDEAPDMNSRILHYVRQNQ